VGLGHEYRRCGFTRWSAYRSSLADRRGPPGYCGMLCSVRSPCPRFGGGAESGVLSRRRRSAGHAQTSLLAAERRSGHPSLTVASPERRKVTGLLRSGDKPRCFARPVRCCAGWAVQVDTPTAYCCDRRGKRFLLACVGDRARLPSTGAPTGTPENGTAESPRPAATGPKLVDPARTASVQRPFESKPFAIRCGWSG